MAYASEEAFRAGLKARLSAEARTSRFSRDELAQTVTLQLFLARLFRSPDADQWILTGGTALQFRAPTQARPTTDADLATRLDAEHMQHSLRQAAHPGPGDFGEFDITITATPAPCVLLRARCICAVLMSAADGGVDRDVPVDLSGCVGIGQDHVQDAIPGPVPGVAGVTLPHGLPRTELLAG